MQNIVIFFMSTFPPAKTTKSHLSKKILLSLKHLWHFPLQRHNPSKSPYNNYHDSTGTFSASCIHTNETAIRYFDWKLHQQNEKIDHVLAIVTDKAKEQLPRFENLFQKKDFQITPIELNGEINMDQSFHTVSNLFSETMKQIEDPTNTTIHIDFTGGLRHTAMLLLALMQMFKFAGVRTGLVTYTNFQSKKIEDATPLVNMFTLISGTNEFKSFGVATHIQEYFSNIPEISPSLSKLIEAIQVFSDKIKVCSNVEDMNVAITDLKKSIDIYHKFLEMNFPMDPQEKLFINLLPYIQKDFQELLDRANTPTYELGLIRWCMQKELLQQAATLYTQWIPKFMIQNKLLELKNTAIMEECEKQGQIWKSWEVGLFQNYSHQNITEDNFNVSNLRKLLETTPPISQVISFIPSSETELRNYFTEAQDLSIYNLTDLGEKIKKLPINNIIIRIINQVRNNQSIDCFLATRIKNSASIQDFFYTNFKLVSNSFLSEKILINNSFGNSKEKILREIVFKNMLDDKTIITKLPKHDLLSLIKNYAIIADIRNSINHANAKQIAEFKETALHDLEILAKYVN